MLELNLFYFREKIFGYKDLVVKMYYTACSLKLYININYSLKVDSEKFGMDVSIIFFFRMIHLKPRFCCLFWFLCTIYNTNYRSKIKVVSMISHDRHIVSIWKHRIDLLYFLVIYFSVLDTKIKETYWKINTFVTTFSI